MQVIKLRLVPRRVLKVRRFHDRRIVPYAFNTPEWVENIKNNYLAWPKVDRRQAARRCTVERRGYDRRLIYSAPLQSSRKFSSIMLSREELELIKDLYKCEMAD